MLSAGTLGDILGRRAVFIAGTAILGAGSLVVYLAAGPIVIAAGVHDGMIGTGVEHTAWTRR